MIADVMNAAVVAIAVVYVVLNVVAVVALSSLWRWGDA